MKSKDGLLKIAKPILFNTEMVRAILDGRKTVTRRCIKLKYSNTHHEMRTDKYGIRLIEIENEVPGVTIGKHEDGSSWVKMRGYIEPKAPYKRGDILYVRETWEEWTGGYLYRAWPDGIHQPGVWMGMPWRPSIHMPKEAARIFLRVTDVRVERLQCMSWDDICNEGIIPDSDIRDKFSFEMLWNKFKNLWNSTIKKSEIDSYGWDANPWVWVIEFERLEVW